jgi:hypothetical protein
MIDGNLFIAIIGSEDNFINLHTKAWRSIMKKIH